MNAGSSPDHSSDLPESKKTAPTMSSRWWEGYLVRYLTGGFVGAGMLLLLTTVYLAPDHTISKPALKNALRIFGYPGFSSPAALILLGVLGLAYCYLTSTPITVYHAGRMKHGGLIKSSKAVWIIVGIVCVFLVPLGKYVPSHITGQWRWIGIIPGAWILANEWWIIFKLLKDEHASTKRIEETEQPKSINGTEDEDINFVPFYIGLALARGQQSTIEIRESYSHLREHANSVFIVILELFFAGCYSDDIYTDRLIFFQ